MSLNSHIEWTEATWNPVTGCTQISPGCAHCYAKTFAERFRGVPGHPYEMGFDLTLRPERLLQPLSWKKPQLIFVNSMSDLFHEQVPDEFIRQVFDTMVAAYWHRFQLLTKRPERLAAMAHCLPFPDNLWVGVSVENQRWTTRIEQLRKVPAAVRFLSCEPLLGALDLRGRLEGIHWVIVGGESGHHSRRMEPKWVRDIQHQCAEAEVAFFFKQWGTYDEAGNRRGKAKSGRLLDNQTWDELPVEVEARLAPRIGMTDYGLHNSLPNINLAREHEVVETLAI
jgi:protein gp37